MSSQYSPDLRIELIGTGEQAGVWGATTNNNLAYVVEQAVAGYISVAVTATNQAFTYINGGSAVAADNQSVHAQIALTTSVVTNDFYVFAPPSSKQYVIYNTTAYTATIYNSTVIGDTSNAGLGVAIPAGRTMAVWSDGTNFRQQNTHLLSPSLTGTPTTPTATYGTSTTQVASTAFVQAALQALYPIGSIYSSTVSTNPGTLFGFGTWVAYAAGRVLIGDGGGFTAGSTGGSADAIVVAHTHTASSSSSFTGSPVTSGLNNVGHTHTFSGTTSGQSNSHSHTVTISDPGHSHSTFVQTVIAGTSSGPDANWWRKDATTTGSATTGITASAGNASVDHTHTYSGVTSGISNDHSHSVTAAGSVSTSTTVNSSGSSGTGANLQPYVVVYMWNRTA